jgi:hypothetical protein
LAPRWEKIFSECKELNLPNVDKHRSQFDFLHAASSIAPEFTSIRRISIQKKNRLPVKSPQTYINSSNYSKTTGDWPTLMHKRVDLTVRKRNSKRMNSKQDLLHNNIYVVLTVSG